MYTGCTGSVLTRIPTVLPFPRNYGFSLSPPPPPARWAAASGRRCGRTGSAQQPAQPRTAEQREDERRHRPAEAHAQRVQLHLLLPRAPATRTPDLAGHREEEAGFAQAQRASKKFATRRRKEEAGLRETQTCQLADCALRKLSPQRRASAGTDAKRPASPSAARRREP